MEVVVCNHSETKEYLPGLDLQVARCSLCGQERKFKVEHKDSIVVTKLGRIDGAVVLPSAGTRYEITPEESRLVREAWDIVQEEKYERQFQEKMIEIKGEVQEEAPYKRKPYTVTPRQHFGIYVKCVGCGKDIYVRKSRMKTAESGRRCRKCYREQVGLKKKGVRF